MHSAVLDAAFEQTRSGAFRSFVHAAGQKQPDSNAFVTVQVMRELRLLSIVLPAAVEDAALGFLMRCQSTDQPALFSFWPADAHPSWLGGQRLPPDADDSALIMLELVHRGRASKLQAHQTLEQLQAYRLRHRDPRPQLWMRAGAYKTWLTHSTASNPVDLVVNANVLALRAHLDMDDSESRILVDMLDAGVSAWNVGQCGIEDIAPYYADADALVLALEHAISEGCRSLALALRRAREGAIESTPEQRLRLPVCRSREGRMHWTCPFLQDLRQQRRDRHAIPAEDDLRIRQNA